MFQKIKTLTNNQINNQSKIKILDLLDDLALKTQNLRHDIIESTRPSPTNKPSNNQNLTHRDGNYL